MINRLSANETAPARWLSASVAFTRLFELISVANFRNTNGLLFATTKKLWLESLRVSEDFTLLVLPTSAGDIKRL